MNRINITDAKNKYDRKKTHLSNAAALCRNPILFIVLALSILLTYPIQSHANSPEEKAVRASLARLVDAFAKADLTNFRMCISPRFIEENPEIPGRVRAFFEKYENISLDYRIASVRIADDIATVTLNWTKTMNNPMNDWRYRNVGNNVVMYFSAVKPFTLIGLEEPNIFGVSFLLRTKIVVPMSTIKLEEARKELELAERRMALKRSSEELEAQRRAESDRRRREKLAIAQTRKKEREQARQEILEKRLAAKAEREAAEAARREELQEKAAQARAEAEREAEQRKKEQIAEVKETTPDTEPPGPHQPLSPEELAQIARLIKAASATFDSVPLHPDTEERISREIRESTDTRAAELLRIQQQREAALSPPSGDPPRPGQPEPSLSPDFTAWRQQQIEEIRAVQRDLKPEPTPPPHVTPLPARPSVDPKLEQEIRRKTDTKAVRLLAEKEAKERKPPREPEPVMEPVPAPDPEEAAKRKAMQQARQDAIMRSKALQAELALSEMQEASEQEDQALAMSLMELQAAEKTARTTALAKLEEEEAARKAKAARIDPVPSDIARLREIEEKAAIEAEIRERANIEASRLLLKKLIPEKALPEDDIETAIADMMRHETTPEETAAKIREEAEARAEQLKTKIAREKAKPAVETKEPVPEPSEIEKDVREKALQEAQALLKKISVSTHEPAPEPEPEKPEPKPEKPEPEPEKPDEPAPVKTPVEKELGPEELKRHALLREAAEQAAAIHEELGILPESAPPVHPEKKAAKPEPPAPDKTAPVKPEPAPEMVLVRGGQQPGGPIHDFMMSRYEITNEEFCRFLNDARENPNHIRGRHMFFDDNGNVFMDSTMDPRKKMFSITNLDFGGKQTGIRYSNGIYSPLPGKEKHPVIGVSWYGALKYCNWLTIAAGYGDRNLAYSEGNEPEQWRPITMTGDEWLSGFSDMERQRWIDSANGFRLPMNSYDSGAGAFNEFYMAAAWNGSTNTTFGFGRNEITPLDANFRTEKGAFPRATAPVGFYNGSDHGGKFQTNPNNNLYGIYDLSGNVWEWSNDTTGNMAYRVVFGGSFEGDPDSLRTSYRGSINPHNTCGNVGIRIVSGIIENKD